MSANGIVINTASIGRNQFRVTARCKSNGEPYVDTAKIWEHPERERVANAIVNHFGLPPEHVEPVRQELTKQAFKLAEQANEPPPEKAENGREVPVKELEPWPESVHLVDVLDEIRQTIQRHMFITDEGATAATLWAAFTHVFDRFNICPLFVIESPVKRCGKTTLLTILKHLVPKPLETANITPAAIFRIIEELQPILLIDEADSFMIDNEELRGILNSGHIRDAAYVVRVNPETLKPECFSTWAPKALAAIGELPGTIEDRAVVIHLHRKPTDITKARLRKAAKQNLESLGRKLARWAKDNVDKIDADAEPHIPETLNDRAADNWQPLLILADMAGGPWPTMARQAATVLSADNPDKQEIAIRLLRDIAEILTGWHDDDFIETKTILERLLAYDEWQHYGRSGRPLNAHQLARLLRPFGLRPVRTMTVRGYRVGDFRPVIKDYAVRPDENKVTDTQSDSRSFDIPCDASGTSHDASKASYDAFDDSKASYVSDVQINTSGAHDAYDALMTDSTTNLNDTWEHGEI